jgi:hypothetical protein
VLEHRQCRRGPDQCIARLAGEAAERVVDVSDAAVGDTPHDQVALRLEQAGGALFRFLQFPHLVGQLLAARGSAAQCGALAVVAGRHHQDEAAGHGEQAADADGEQVGIVDRRVDAIQVSEQHERHRHRADSDEHPAHDGQDLTAADVKARPHMCRAGANLHKVVPCPKLAGRSAGCPASGPFSRQRPVWRRETCDLLPQRRRFRARLRRPFADRSNLKDIADRQGSIRGAVRVHPHG